MDDSLPIYPSIAPLEHGQQHGAQLRRCRALCMGALCRIYKGVPVVIGIVLFVLLVYGFCLLEEHIEEQDEAEVKKEDEQD